MSNEIPLGEFVPFTAAQLPDFASYSRLAMTTAKDFPFAKQCEHAQIGMIGELGELADAIKKVTIYGKPLDPVNVIEEVGDYLWYLQLLGVTCQHDLEDADAVTIAEEDFQHGLDYGLIRDLNMANSVLCNAFWFQENEPEESSDPGYVVEGLGTMLAMLKGVCSLVGMTVNDAYAANLNKLIGKRYRNGYSDAAALNRDTGAERQQLEADLGKGA